MQQNLLSAGSLDGSFTGVTTDVDYLSSRLSYISGVSIARNVAMVELGLEMEIGKNSTIDLSYDGQFASSSTAHQANARLGVSF